MQIRRKDSFDDCIKIEEYIKKAPRDIGLVEAELGSFAQDAGKTFKKEKKKFG